MPTYFVTFVFVFLMWTVKDSTQIQNVKLILPKIVQAGSSATLLCLYDLEGTSLYSVQWYRGQFEFFRFVPNEHPQTKIFQIPGLYVDTLASSEHQVTLRNIPLHISGEFSCEITTDSPRFSTSCVSENLTVIDLKLNLIVPKKQYLFGDIIDANCTLTPILPSAKVIFHWNAKPISDEHYINNRIFESVLLHLNTSIFEASQTFPVLVQLRCSAILDGKYYIESKSIPLTLKPLNPKTRSTAAKSDIGMSDSLIENQFQNDSVELSFPVPWGVIAAKTFGDPCLPSVLMVHGIQDNAGTFDRIMPLLPSTFYYVCIDLPGHGKSSRFPKGIYLDFILYISAIRRVVCQLQWTEFYYIGHSLGGQMGSYYAAFYPEEVKKLVIIDTLAQLTVSLDGFIKYYKEHIRQMLEVEEKMLKKSPPNYTYEEALSRMINHRPSFITRDAAKAILKRSLKDGKNNCYYFSTDQRLKFGVRTAMSNKQHLSIISKIQCPVLLIITSTYLHFVENYRKNNFEALTLKLFKSKNNFQIIEVDGHHDVHNNEPEIVAPYICKFLIHQRSVL